MPSWERMTIKQANEMFGGIGCEVLQDINNGTFKQVFRAKYKGQIVALKVIRQEGLDFRNRREIIAMESINSPYVAKIINFSLGSSEYLPYVIEEFVPGASLQEKWDFQIVSVQEFFPLFADIFQALLACASNKIVHRDVKPQNILLRDSGNAVLTDFGLARLLDESTITAVGTRIGTLAYAPPEFINYRSENISETSDLFSVGVMAYWMLTGKHPFLTLDAHDPKPTDLQMLENEAIPLEEFGESFSPLLSDFIMFLIQRQPADRYPSTDFAWKQFQRIRQEFKG